MEKAFESSPDFVPSHGQEPGTLIVYNTNHVKWKEIDGRTEITYIVDFFTVEDFKSDQRKKLGTITGSCWDDSFEVCATQILAEAKAIAARGANENSN